MLGLTRCRAQTQLGMTCTTRPNSLALCFAMPTGWAWQVYPVGAEPYAFCHCTPDMVKLSIFT